METVRTCLVCRKKAGKPGLCRFVRATDGEICFDEKGELPHRGAWICPNRSCLIKAFSKRLLFRDERTLPINQEVMLKSMQDRIKKSALARMGLMRKRGHIEMGREAVKRKIFEGNPCAVILAKDFAKRSLDEINGKLSESKVISVVESPLLMDEIGQCLGRRKTGVVALLESRITDEILLQIDKLKELEL